MRVAVYSHLLSVSNNFSMDANADTFLYYAIDTALHRLDCASLPQLRECRVVRLMGAG